MFSPVCFLLIFPLHVGFVSVSLLVLSYLTFVHYHKMLPLMNYIELHYQERIFFRCSNNEMVVDDIERICQFIVSVSPLNWRSVHTIKSGKIKTNIFQVGFALSVPSASFSKELFSGIQNGKSTSSYTDTYLTQIFIGRRIRKMYFKY